MTAPKHMKGTIIGEHLLKMAHSPIGNYIVPGVTSSLIGDGTALKGRVRMFDASREQHDEIVPHSHRFDLLSIVLQGMATNTVWREAPPHSGESYVVQYVEYCGEVGTYKKVIESNAFNWTNHSTTYKAGESYWMKHDEIHSIKFSKGAIVLILEGPEVTKRTRILQPVVDGQVIETFKVEPWMFKRMEAS